MGSVLVAYATRHGSTREVAEAVATALEEGGVAAEAKPISDDLDPAGYDAVVVGGPMIMGWHKDALRFLRRNQGVLATVPTAYFITAASLTKTGEDRVGDVPISADPWLVKEPRAAGRLSRRERYALPAHYLGKALGAATAVRPRRVAFFAGCLDLTTMNLFEKLFVLLVVGATPGDGRHWDFVKEWSHELVGDLRPA
jgi:menaquinone-dependent protoporphyrinogen IX oxidase